MFKMRGIHTVRSSHGVKKQSNIGVIVLIILAISIALGFIIDFAWTKIEYSVYPQPASYVGYVEKYSEKFDVPKEIIWAVIKTESNFDASAVSGKGAVGLMQLTEPTFEEISNLRLKEGLPSGMRYDPETSIRYGTYYLSYLYDRYGDWDTVLAAYNGGLGKVDGWMGEDGKLALNEIPLDYFETISYVIKVNFRAERYKKLYAS